MVQGLALLLARLLRAGHDGVRKAVFGACCKAAHATDAVGMAHKLSIRNVDVHGTSLVAKLAVAAASGIAANTEDTQYTPQTGFCAAGAEVVAERAVEEQANDDETKQDAESRGLKHVSFHQGAKELGGMKMGKESLDYFYRGIDRH